MYTSLVLYFSIFALSKERTRLSFHCWLYNLCIVVYVTNKTWNLKLVVHALNSESTYLELSKLTQFSRSETDNSEFPISE